MLALRAQAPRSRDLEGHKAPPPLSPEGPGPHGQTFPPKGAVTQAQESPKGIDKQCLP